MIFRGFFVCFAFADLLHHRSYTCTYEKLILEVQAVSTI